ncbi:hypothetical protein JYP46_21165 [Nitratireductor aquimarinus]|uniref:hypothetical protein n=1 Tax=Alphaproteobacteria TaxID=28211 RepID=UPI0019D32DAD|nr:MULTISPECIES: hypothetical protein [Alphaproteobacteria]MBN7759339.1 hypothetical protein [Nitratireductor aquimarinus]MBY6002150.1 hypothetical protein [Tritonibacter mobilis]MBY6024589.1 hypothetical protein [Nitratireductor sp. DP7N14-4]
MKPHKQKQLAIAGAILVGAVFIFANAHFLSVAISSAPDCAVIADVPPAKPAC